MLDRKILVVRVKLRHRAIVLLVFYLWTVSQNCKPVPRNSRDLSFAQHIEDFWNLTVPASGMDRGTCFPCVLFIVKRTIGVLSTSSSSNDTLRFPPQTLHKHYFSFSLGRVVGPEKNWKQRETKGVYYESSLAISPRKRQSTPSVNWD